MNSEEEILREIDILRAKFADARKDTIRKCRHTNLIKKYSDTSGGWDRNYKSTTDFLCEDCGTTIMTLTSYHYENGKTDMGLEYKSKTEVAKVVRRKKYKYLKELM
jgi:hypothetical protein